MIDLGFTDAQIVEKATSETVNKEKPEEETGQYTVQIKALTQKVDPKTFTNLEGVKIYKGKDGFYRYTFGSFETIEQALEAKKQIEADKMLADAFIVLIKNLKKY